MGYREPGKDNRGYNYPVYPRLHGMRKVLTILIAVCLVLIAGLFAVGQYFSLWSGSLLKPKKQVDIHVEVQLHDDDLAPIKQHLPKKYEIQVTSTNMEKGFSGTYMTDMNGDLKLYLFTGRYSFNIDQTIILSQGVFRLYSDQLNKINLQEDVKVEIPLLVEEEKDAERLMRLIDRSLAQGALEDAKRICDMLTYSGYQDMVQSKRMMIESLYDMLALTETLPTNAYLSLIRIYNHMLRTLENHLPGLPTEELKISHSNRLIYLQKRINTLQEIRRQIIEQHLDDFESFYQIRLYPIAAAQWVKIIDDNELYDLNYSLEQPVQSRLLQTSEKANRAIEKTRHILYFRLNRAKDYYQHGRLDKSLELFYQIDDILSRLQSLFASEGYIEKQCRSYIQDILNTYQGDEAYNIKNYVQAEAYYRRIENRTARINGRLKRLEALNKEKSKQGIQPVEDANYSFL